MININKKIQEFNKNGFTIINVFNDQKFKILNDLIKNKIYSYCNIKSDLEKDEYPLKYYHDWFLKKKLIMIGYVVESKDIFTQILKFQIFLKNLVINYFLKSLGVKNYSMWDDSFGFIGFRMIRPNYNDGYPLSCKSMGFAKK